MAQPMSTFQVHNFSCVLVYTQVSLVSKILTMAIIVQDERCQFHGYTWPIHSQINTINKYIQSTG